VSLLRRRKELDFIGMAFVVNLAEDEFKKLPECFRLLKALIACDVVVAATEGKKQSV
jgi:hypothetical protein